MPNLSWLAVLEKSGISSSYIKSKKNCFMFKKLHSRCLSQWYFMLTSLCNRFYQSYSSRVGKGTRVKRFGFTFWSEV